MAFLARASRTACQSLLSEAGKPIAAPSFSQSVKIGEFQIVFANCIPDIAHRDVPSLGDAIEGVFDELVHRDAFRE